MEIDKNQNVIKISSYSVKHPSFCTFFILYVVW